MSSPIPKGARSKREAMRLLLSDGQWHHVRECISLGGTRFGARLQELRDGRGGPKLPNEHRRVPGGNDNEFEYRAIPAPVPQAELALGPAKRPTARQRIEQLARENLQLKRRVAELEGAGASA